jgi:hypothetical protein
MVHVGKKVFSNSANYFNLQLYKKDECMLKHVSKSVLEIILHDKYEHDKYVAHVSECECTYMYARVFSTHAQSLTHCVY